VEYEAAPRILLLFELLLYNLFPKISQSFCCGKLSSRVVLVAIFGGVSMRIFRWNWFWLIVLAVGVVSVVLFDRFEKKVGKAPSERTLVDADVIAVHSEEVPILREVTGAIVSANEATLSSRVVGRIENVRVKEGGVVKKGDLLLTLDSRDLQAQRDRAEAELENATEQLRRVRSLYAERSAAKQELDNAERSHKVAEAALRAVEADLSYTVIKAPFDGIITNKMIEQGELTSPGRSLLRIEDQGHYRLETSVAETDLPALRIGQQVTVRLDALGDEPIPSRIGQILPAADPSTHSFLVKADLAADPRLKSGLFGRMVFPVGRRSTLLVPRSAVSVRGELARVYVVVESGLIQSRLIQLGKTHDDRVEVLSGLASGEQILARASEGGVGEIVRGREDSRP
jgi:RND family efflux transporter MFP subunit